MEKLLEFFDNLKTTPGVNGYPYVLFPLTDYNPPAKPELFDELARQIVSKNNFSQTDVLVGQADRGGGPLVHAVAQKVNIPFALASWYPKETYAQILVENAGTFSGPGFICLNGLKPNQKVSIVVDLISTGGTTLALAQAVKKAGAEIVNIISACENVDFSGMQKIESIVGIKPMSVIKYKIENSFTKVI